jgi:predicted DNA-binding antitoxin AbrB/MazE fold protein
MPITVEAVYENSVLRPVQPLPLGEHEKVSVTIESTGGWVDRTSGMRSGRVIQQSFAVI